MRLSNLEPDPSTDSAVDGAQAPLVWDVEPIRIAMSEAEARREGPSDTESFIVCTEVGRRILLTHFTFSNWVLRRVEKVQFDSDRRISRSSSIEFRVPDEAPVIHSRGTEPRWLIPLSVMRRHTLVNLDLRNEEGEGINLIGLRFTQKLDESMLRAAARLACPKKGSYDDIDEFIRQTISGTLGEVQNCYDDYEGWRVVRGTPKADGHKLNAYFRHPTFRATLERLWHNFTLYVTVPVREGRHRLVRLAFEERVDWRYQLPNLKPEDKPTEGREVWQYHPLAHKFQGWRQPGHFFGWRSTRIRFLVPSAENCASYHFEFTAPTGLLVTKAAFAGGRPNLRANGVTPWDSVTTAGHSVGLHAVEVPNGSLPRAQVSLRVPTRGWLSTLLVSCWATFLAMVAVTYHAHLYGHEGHWGTGQVTNIVLLLVTVSVGASTYVAQHPSGDVAARMVTGLRIFGVAALAVPAVAAVSLLFLPEPPPGDASSVAAHIVVFPRWFPGFLDGHQAKSVLEWWLRGLTGFEVACAVLVTGAWFSSLTDERHSGRVSPWDMTTVNEEPASTWKRFWRQRKKPLDGATMAFDRLVKKLGLTKRAVGVYSAEGWHERYGWTNDAQTRAVNLLRDEADSTRKPKPNPTGCDCDDVKDHCPKPKPKPRPWLLALVVGARRRGRDGLP